VKRNIKKIARAYKALHTTGYVAKAWEKGRFTMNPGGTLALDLDDVNRVVK